jgi:hypothetical protein
MVKTPWKRQVLFDSAMEGGDDQDGIDWDGIRMENGGY